MKFSDLPWNEQGGLRLLAASAARHYATMHGNLDAICAALKPHGIDRADIYSHLQEMVQRLAACDLENPEEIDREIDQALEKII